MSPEPDARITSAVFAEIGRRLQARDRRPVVLGICGAQGSGKSTLARCIGSLCNERGIVAAALSLDDLYLTRAERERLARDVHPLLRTRGVPGTHDVALGLELLAAFERGQHVALPSFDKAIDDRLPQSSWECSSTGCEVLVLEGWCLGALPQTAEALRQPINALEQQEDPDGRWRSYVNAALAGDYQRLFSRIDSLILLAAPSFEIVFDWRLQQEAQLSKCEGPNAPGLMDAPEIARFIQYFERLTRHMLAEMPARADLVVRLLDDRTPASIEQRMPPS